MSSILPNESSRNNPNTSRAKVFRDLRLIFFTSCKLLSATAENPSLYINIGFNLLLIFIPLSVSGDLIALGFTSLSVHGIQWAFNFASDNDVLIFVCEFYAFPYSKTRDRTDCHSLLPGHNSSSKASGCSYGRPFQAGRTDISRLNKRYIGMLSPKFPAHLDLPSIFRGMRKHYGLSDNDVH